MNYLITVVDILEYEDISVNVKEARLTHDIRKAHELDLKGFFGTAFYWAVIKGIKFDVNGVYDPLTTSQIYRDLYEGKEYVDRQGHTIVYEGLKRSLVYYTLARFIKTDRYRFTATGPVGKRHDQSDALTQKEVIMLTEGARSEGNAYTNEVEKFLNDNRNDYPLWRINYRNKESRQPGPRIRSVDRTDFNLRGNRNFNNRFGLDNFLD